MLLDEAVLLSSDSLDSIPFINFTVSSLITDAKQLLALAFPKWIPKDWSIETDGITNKLIKCILYSGDIILFRVYGIHSDILINRTTEFDNFQTLSRLGLSPPVHAKFSNGLIYGFTKGRPFTVDEMQDPFYSSLIAAKVAQWHSIDVSSSQNALFATLDKWLQAIPAKFTCPSRNNTFDGSFTRCEIRREFLFLRNEFENSATPLAFCHCDLLSGNVILNESQSSVEFIDYEYGMVTNASFDIANHWCEYAGFSCDYSNYPSIHSQTLWITSYLTALKPKTPPTKNLIEETRLQVERFSCLPHFFWFIWSLVQAEVSEIQFDYMEYAKLRYAEYLRRKVVLSYHK